MELLDHLSLGLAVALTPQNILYCLVGAILGTLIGVLPGIGPLATLAMLLPMTFGLAPAGSLIMLAGIYYGAQYGGSTTAILINLPGESSAAVTTIDGYQMARRGRASSALSAAAIASFIAGTLATILIAVVADPLTELALTFGPHEYFALLVLGLASSVALAAGSMLKGVGMICLGLLISLHGTDLTTGASRFTYGLPDLRNGLDFVAVSVGVFAVSEILRNLERATTSQAPVTAPKVVWPSGDDLRRIIAPALRGTAIGSVLGVLPGGGALLSSFVAYNVEKRISPNAAEFGNGAIEGVAAPEAANNAGAQTSFIPMLSLGIPSNAVMALMIGALVMQGIVPGPEVATRNPELFWGLIVSMWVGNAILVILNLPLIGLWVKLLKIPYSVLYPAIIAFSCIGVFSIENSTFPIYQVVFAGLLGYLLIKLEFELAPLILGFILGAPLEEHLRRALLLSGGELTGFVTRPISAMLLLLAAAMLVAVALPTASTWRARVFGEQ